MMRLVKLREINCQSTLTLTWRLEQNGWHFANNILKCDSLKMCVFLLKFHWNLFIMVQIRMVHLLQVMAWCCQATSHYLSQCWPISIMITKSYLYNIQEWETVNSFTVSLHKPSCRHLPAVRAVQGDCQLHLKNSRNSHWPHQPTIHCTWGNPNLNLDLPITKGWCQPIGSHVSSYCHWQSNCHQARTV